MELLEQNNYISEQQLGTLIKMVKFRNRAVHLYDKIDEEEIYHIIQKNLSDFDDFIAAIVRYFM